jgi:uncharacterized protein
MINGKDMNRESLLRKLIIGKWSIFFKIYLYMQLIVLLADFFRRFVIILMIGYSRIVDLHFEFLPHSGGGSENLAETFSKAYFEAFLEVFSDLSIDFVLYQILTLIVILFLLFIVDRYKREDLGLSFELKSLFVFMAGILAAIFVVSLVALLLYFNNNLIFHGFTQEVRPDITNLRNMIIFQGVLYSLVAIQEELFARSFLINGFKWAGKYLSVIIPSGIFALLHLGNIVLENDGGYVEIILNFLMLKFSIDSYLGILNIFLLSLLFSIYFIKFKDLWFVIGAHLGWNFFMGTVLGMPVSNIEKLNERSFFSTTLQGADFMMGGTFGPEGSLVTSIVLTAILGVSLFLIREKGE